MSAKPEESDQMAELLKLRDEFNARLAERIEDSAGSIASPEIWLARKTSRLEELRAVIGDVKAERDAAAARYDEQIGRLERRVKELEEELRYEREAIDRAQEDAREQAAPPKRPKGSRKSRVEQEANEDEE